MILALLRLVGTAATVVCDEVDKALDLDHEVRQALKDLRKRVESLKSVTMVYKVLLSAMEKDTDLNGRSPYTRFIQRYVMGCTQAHMLTQLSIYNITDKTERKQWKALKERSRLRDHCSRATKPR